MKIRIKNGNAEISGHLRVGSYETLSAYLCPEFLSSLKNNLLVSIRTSQKQNHILALESGELDLLVDAEPRIAGDFSSYPLYSDHFAFYIDRQLVDSDFSKHPLIYVPSVYDENDISLENYISKMNLRNNDRMELDSFTAACSFCEKGLGLAILPTRLAAFSVKQGYISPVGLRQIGVKSFGKHTIFATIKNNRLKVSFTVFLT